MSAYEDEVEQALNLTQTTTPHHSHRMTEALGAAVRDHERTRLTNTIVAWADTAGLSDEQWAVVDHIRALIHRG